MNKMYKPVQLLLVILLGLTFSASAQTTYTFSYTGSAQTWTVPPGVTSVVVTAQGAAGGLNGQTTRGCLPGTCGNMADSPGHGGCVVCTLTVTPGVIMQINVGGRGGDATTTIIGAGGWNGGGPGGLGYVPYCGGGGGGGSDIRIPPYALGNRVVVGAGGGGAGGDYFLPPVNYEKGGDGGGLTGEAGMHANAYNPEGGGGGGPLSGGVPGTYPGWCTGIGGAFGVGAAACNPGGGGGGGGGWWGGGGGAWGGGGGGSNYADATLTSGAVHTRGCNVWPPDGLVTIVNLCTPPVGGTILGPSVICANSTGTYTDPTGTAGGVWTSSNPGVCTINPVTGFATFLAGGVSTITYSITLACGFASATHVVNVNPLPAPITGLTNICTGSTSPLTDITGGGVWSGSNPTVATIDSFSGVVSGLTVGFSPVTYTLISTGCQTFATVNVVGISGAHKVCALDTIHLWASSGGGVWSTSSTTLASIDTNGVLTGNAMGIVTVSYTLPLGCTALWTVSVNPHAPIVGRDSVCIGSFRYLTNIVGGGVWSSKYPSVATVLPDSGKVFGWLAGIDTIKYLLPTGCLSTTAFTVVNYPGAITGIRQVCPGATTALGDPTAGGAWSSTNPSVATVDGSGVVTGVMADTVDIVYTIQPGCPVSAKVIVNPLPDTITGPTVVCPGTIDTMHDASPGGLWSSSNLPVVTIVDTDGVFTAIKGGTTTIQYQLPTGCLTTTTLTVRPIPVPAIFYNYLLNTLYATPGYTTYQWYDSVQGKIPGATSPSLAATTTEYYWVEVTDAFGCKGWSPYYHFNLNSVGVKNYLNGNSIKIYPNPATSMLYISSPVPVRAVISSVEGKKEIDVADAKEIDISELANGIYMVTLYDEDGVRITVTKLVKE